MTALRSTLLALALAVAVGLLAPAGALATDSAGVRPRAITSCDGEFGPKLQADFRLRTQVAWSLVGVGRDGRSLLIGMRRGWNSKTLCASLVRSDRDVVRLVVWSSYEVSLCSRHEEGFSECLLLGRAPIAGPVRIYRVPLGVRVAGQRILGGRRSRVSPLTLRDHRPYRAYRRGLVGQTRVPNLVGLRVADARDVLAGLRVRGLDAFLPWQRGLVTGQQPASTDTNLAIIDRDHPGLVFRTRPQRR